MTCSTECIRLTRPFSLVGNVISCSDVRRDDSLRPIFIIKPRKTIQPGCQRRALERRWQTRKRFNRLISRSICGLIFRMFFECDESLERHEARDKPLPLRHLRSLVLFSLSRAGKSHGKQPQPHRPQTSSTRKVTASAGVIGPCVQHLQRARDSSVC
jgi:hypothetical protein